MTSSRNLKNAVSAKIDALSFLLENAKEQEDSFARSTTVERNKEGK